MSGHCVMVIGGAGFVGYHVAKKFLSDGHVVHVVDNLSRNGARANYLALQTEFLDNERLVFRHADIRNFADVRSLLESTQPDLLIHEAAQVAVTTSVVNPRLDFEINALGTFNVLEAVRLASPETFFVFASTNKVYGGMEELPVIEDHNRFQFKNLPQGVNEAQPLDFHSPYACSKGAADQYVHDYSRIYGLRTCVFRQSCIYGTHQYGVEDQGWIAWFTIARVINRPVTIYGSGKQVRDILWVGDLVDAYAKAWQQNAKGGVYNIGGGDKNAISLLELVEYLDKLQEARHPLKFGPERPGDQPVYISDITKVGKELGWTPTVSPRQGIESLHNWVRANRDAVESVFGK